MTYYDILEVKNTASLEVIQMAYKALAKKYHPDLNQGNIAVAEARMKLLNEAYRVLSDPNLRAEYDRRINSARQTTPNTSNTYSQNTNTSYSYQNTRTQDAKRASYVPPKGKPSKLWLAVLIIFIIVAVFASNGSEDKQTESFVDTEQEELMPVAAPYSGKILSGYERSDGSEITVTAAKNADCVVKLKSSSGSTKLSFYVRAGTTVTVGVPAEYMYVYFACGETWYGENELFGEQTTYSMDDELLDFTSYTWEYTLTPIENGNFSETPIDASDF